MSSAATPAETTAPPPSGRTPRKAAPAGWIGSALGAEGRAAAEPAGPGAGR